MGLRHSQSSGVGGGPLEVQSLPCLCLCPGNGTQGHVGTVAQGGHRPAPSTSAKPEHHEGWGVCRLWTRTRIHSWSGIVTGRDGTSVGRGLSCCQVQTSSHVSGWSAFFETGSASGDNANCTRTWGLLPPGDCSIWASARETAEVSGLTWVPTVKVAKLTLMFPPHPSRPGCSANTS